MDLPEEVEPFDLEIFLTRVNASRVEVTTSIDIVFSRNITDEIPALSGAVFDFHLTGEIVAEAVVPEVSPLALTGLAGVGFLLARHWRRGRAAAA